MSLSVRPKRVSGEAQKKTTAAASQPALDRDPASQSASAAQGKLEPLSPIELARKDLDEAIAKVTLLIDIGPAAGAETIELVAKVISSRLCQTFRRVGSR